MHYLKVVVVRAHCRLLNIYVQRMTIYLYNCTAQGVAVYIFAAFDFFHFYEFHDACALFEVISHRHTDNALQPCVYSSPPRVYAAVDYFVYPFRFMFKV